MQCLGIHHCAIICSDYQKSKHFYVNLLGFRIIHETYRADRQSYKLDLQIGDGSYGQIELFSFPEPPERPTRPEARGLRHLAFIVDDVRAAVSELKEQGIETEPIRIDEFTGKPFTFFRDPDDLPLELYQK
ncbi:SMU1112c/YaeR family gloxylase I-like metalloprotein [Sporolactobacillus putidus]|uniref:VOC family protein n=1 Tax=Sporolactobacillus putidus TaxID=492735 RepID=A0A917RYQ7_9BACL|nr:VOC family protein [Sporolactobacillus putidus]GGL46594.1 VOC family protein [Sporolactobacillus putidus]